LYIAPASEVLIQNLASWQRGAEEKAAIAAETDAERSAAIFLEQERLQRELQHERLEEKKREKQKREQEDRQAKLLKQRREEEDRQTALQLQDERRGKQSRGGEEDRREKQRRGRQTGKVESFSF
jgi:hypothetical protein